MGRTNLSVIKNGLVKLIIPLFMLLLCLPTKANELLYEKMRIFSEVIEKVHQQYVEEVSKEELLDAALKEMVSSLDPHSAYMNKREFNELNMSTKGEFVGIGVEVTLNKDGYFEVITPIDNTPAADAGLKSGDLIIKVGDTTLLGKSINECVDLVRGKVGSVVRLTILRKGLEPFVVKVKRDKIELASVEVALYGDIPVFRISAFNEKTTSDLKKLIIAQKKQLGEKELPGLLLDLRNNPGGILEQAISVSGLFLEKSTLVVVSRGRTQESEKKFFTKSNRLVNPTNTPIIVLINASSASAAEIVAGALKDHNKATIIGERSFGKGSVQTLIPFMRGRESQGGMKLTTARYYTPNGYAVQGNGIEPDFKVSEMSEVQDDNVYEKNLDSSLEVEKPITAAVKLSDEVDSHEAEPQAEKTVPLLKDVQLLYALYHLQNKIKKKAK